MYYQKICNIALIVTSIVVFIIWQLVNTINFPHYVDSWIQYTIKSFINLIFAYGFFNGFVFLFIKLLEKVTFIKKAIYGKSYIEGTWIGYYITSDNEFIMYANVIQTVDEIHINGKAFYKNKNTRCFWNSSSSVTIDHPNNKMSFMYQVETIDDNGAYKGLIEFVLEEKRGISKNPHRMSGYAFNLHSKEKIESKLEKYNILKPQKGDSKDEEEILFNKALEIYQKNKEE